MQHVFCLSELTQQEQELHHIQDLYLDGDEETLLPMHAVEYLFCRGTRPLRSLDIYPNLLDDTCQQLAANQLTQLKVIEMEVVCLRACACV